MSTVIVGKRFAICSGAEKNGYSYLGTAITAKFWIYVHVTAKYRKLLTAKKVTPRCITANQLPPYCITAEKIPIYFGYRFCQSRCHQKRENRQPPKNYRRMAIWAFLRKHPQSVHKSYIAIYLRFVTNPPTQATPQRYWLHAKNYGVNPITTVFCQWRNLADGKIITSTKSLLCQWRNPANSSVNTVQDTYDSYEERGILCIYQVGYPIFCLSLVVGLVFAAHLSYSSAAKTELVLISAYKRCRHLPTPSPVPLAQFRPPRISRHADINKHLVQD